MAFKLFGKMDFLGRLGAGAGADSTIIETADGTVQPAGRGAPGRLPVIGAMPLNQQFQILAAAFAIFFIIAAGLAIRENRIGAQGAAYSSAVGQMRMLSQRLAKSAQLSLQGNAAAFKELRESRDTFGSLLE